MPALEVFLQEVGIEAESVDELTQGEAYQREKHRGCRSFISSISSGLQIESVMVPATRGFLSDGRDAELNTAVNGLGLWLGWHRACECRVG